MSKSGRQQGELEALVLDTLWGALDSGASPLTSQQIMDALGAETDIAMTTLFAAAKSREVHSADLMLKLMTEAGNPALAMSHFAAGLSPAALEALRNTLK